MKLHLNHVRLFCHPNRIHEYNQKVKCMRINQWGNQLHQKKLKNRCFLLWISNLNSILSIIYQKTCTSFNLSLSNLAFFPLYWLIDWKSILIEAKLNKAQNKRVKKKVLWFFIFHNFVSDSLSSNKY